MLASSWFAGGTEENRLQPWRMILVSGRRNAECYRRTNSPRHVSSRTYVSKTRRVSRVPDQLTGVISLVVPGNEE